jgi:nucleoside-diphosphate-sugar epimerase
LTPTHEQRVGFMAQITGWTGQIVKLPPASLPAHLQDTYDYSCDLAYDTGRIRRELGYKEQVSREEGLQRTVDDLHAHTPKFDAAQYNYTAEDDALAAIQSAESPAG